MGQLFFNVKHSLRMNGKLCVPAVSYKLPVSWQSDAEELMEAGKLCITDRVVVFQNGRPVDRHDKEVELLCFMPNKNAPVVSPARI
jgi:hypothetical protein